MTTGIDKKIWWLCLEGHYSYESPIFGKTRLDKKPQGCPDCWLLKKKDEAIDIDMYIEQKNEQKEIRENEVYCLACKKYIPKNDCMIHFKTIKHEHVINTNIFEKFFINTHPYLLYEWNEKKNKHIDIFTLTTSTHTKIHWICKNNNNHKWKVGLHHRTDKNDPSGCKDCFNDTQKCTLYDSTVTKNNMTLGKETEEYITNILKNSDKFKEVFTIGYLAGSADISITLQNGDIVYLQVKTLTQQKKKKQLLENSYYMSYDTLYDDDLLIALLNKERTKFVVEFAGNLKIDRDLKKGSKIGFTFNSTLSKKNKDIMFTDEKSFLNNLVCNIPKSSKFNKVCDSVQKEINMHKRLEEFCLKNNMTFKRNEINSNAVDCYINNYRIQTKFVTLNYPTSSTYGVSNTKSNGVDKQIPYRFDDFDFMIVEVGGVRGDDENKYLNNFCIISTKKLNKKKYLQNKKYEGISVFSICSPEYSGGHWSKKYWNYIKKLRKIKKK